MKRPVVISIVVIGVVAMATAGIIFFSKQGTNTTASAPTATEPTGSSSTSTTTPAQTTSQTYKDGSYTATGSYTTPGGTEKIKITITIKNDKITAASAVSLAASHDSREYQADFISGFQAQVVGKSIDSVNLSSVSGSSLTPVGFNNALASIKTQAKA